MRYGGGAQAGAAGALSEWGTLDRRELAKRNVKTVLAENSVVIGTRLPRAGSPSIMSGMGRLC